LPPLVDHRVPHPARFPVRGDVYVAGVLGAISKVDNLELAEVEAAVGSASFGRGRDYARGNRVLKIEWDTDTETLTGSVVGQGALYDTAAFFASDGGGLLGFDDGECTCPVGYNCKHVAAIVIAASDGHGSDRRRFELRRRRSHGRQRSHRRPRSHGQRWSRGRGRGPCAR
jgi:uncharacterized Zn finger protein